jgi:hypothetical protein
VKSLVNATAYTVRKSSRKWAKLSVAGEDDCSQAGRWAANSPHQNVYSQAGMFEGDLESQYTGYLPMTKVMTFKNVTYMELNDASALQNHINYRGYD